MPRPCTRTPPSPRSSAWRARTPQPSAVASVAYEHGVGARRLPEWLRRPIAHGGEYAAVEGLLDELHLSTVCREAKCPNRGECYASGTATFLIAGDVCTRGCRFCAVESRHPAPLDPDEPARVAEAIARMGLRHAVITMVTRDDLADGAAGHVAATIVAVRDRTPEVAIEVLVSDLRGQPEAIDTVVDALPDVFNHNVETVPRLYETVRPGADYRRSLGVLARVKGRVPQIPVKSGLMLGLGETHDEVVAVMRDLREAGCELLTLGQYLRPSAAHLPVAEFVEPSEFAELARVGRRLGFSGVASAPLVRSSYHAAELLG
ncbi:MAG: lipoyl synthase [Coriobacteriia bacterium]|nr:lipoyl synthase [Coriobacteriia bacterium]MBN2847912.1 lipoyl synthase [Coriobacteriia bacterium]